MTEAFASRPSGSSWTPAPTRHAWRLTEPARSAVLTGRRRSASAGYRLDFGEGDRARESSCSSRAGVRDRWAWDGRGR